MLLSDSLVLFYQSMDGVLSPATVRWYRNRLPSLLTIGNIEITAITLADLRAWRSSLAARASRWGGSSSHPTQRGGYSPYTLHQYVRAARRLFRWLELEGLIPASPARRLELPRLPSQYRRGIPSADRDRMLAAAQDPRDYAILLFFADTACRLSGLAGLRLADLDLDHCQAVLHEKGRGGQAKARPVFYLEPTQRAIKAWLAVRNCEHDYLFCGRRGEPLAPAGVYQVFKRLARAAGIAARWNPHEWRHGSIRGMLANRMAITAVSQIAGHASVQTTGDLYGIFCESELAEMHKKFSWLARPETAQPTAKTRYKPARRSMAKRLRAARLPN